MVGQGNGLCVLARHLLAVLRDMPHLACQQPHFEQHMHQQGQGQGHRQDQGWVHGG